MIIQATKAPNKSTKALKGTFAGGMQENPNSFYCRTSSYRIRSPHSPQLQILCLTCVIPPLTLLLWHPTLLLPYKHNTVIYLSTQKSVFISLFYRCFTTSGAWETYWKQAQTPPFCILPWILLLCLKSAWALLEADLQEFLFCHLLCECWDTAEQLNTCPHPSLTKSIIEKNIKDW